MNSFEILVSPSFLWTYGYAWVQGTKRPGEEAILHRGVMVNWPEVMWLELPTL